MKKLIRDPLFHTLLLLIPFLWAWVQHGASAQPVPKQEQNTRLIQAIEQQNRVLEQHSRALDENTRAVREMTQALRSQGRTF